MKTLFFLTALMGVSFFGHAQPGERILSINACGHKGLITCLEVDKNGAVISAGYDKVIRVWNSSEGYREREIYGQVGPGKEGAIISLALSPDNKLLAVGGWFGKDDGSEVATTSDIRLYDYESGKIIKLLTNNLSVASDIIFLEDSRRVISVQQGSVVLSDVETTENAVLGTIPADVREIQVVGNFLVTAHVSGLFCKWDLNDLQKPVATYKKLAKGDFDTEFGALVISPNGERVALSNGYMVYILDKNLKEIFSFNHGIDEVLSLAYSPNSERLLVTAGNNKENSPQLMQVYEEREDGWFELSPFMDHRDAVHCGVFVTDNTCVTAGGSDREVAVWKVERTKKNCTLLHWLPGAGNKIFSAALTDDQLAFSTTRTRDGGYSAYQVVFGLADRDFRLYQQVDSFPLPSRISGSYSVKTPDARRSTLVLKKDDAEIAKISRDATNGSTHSAVTFVGEKYLVTGGYYGTLEAFDFSGALVSQLVGHEASNVTGVSVSSDGRFVVSCSEDQTIRLWKSADIGIKKVIYPTASVFIAKNNEWVIWNEEGYFTSSKKGASYIGFHINRGHDKEAKFYPFEQFDTRYNRPDVIMESLGVVDETVIALYRAAYYKRLKRLGLEESDLGYEMNAPILELHHNPVSKEKIMITISAADSLYPITAINVFLNEVPVFGRNGLPLGEEGSFAIEKSFELDLMTGVNSVQVSVTNSAGVESLKEQVVVHNTLQTDCNLYVVSVGVSAYMDSAYNLNYAAKDAEDVSTLFTSNTYFKKVHEKILLNEQVNRKNLLEIQNFLQLADRNDVVIFFIAGHGVLNKDLDYFFCTHDMDFRSPEKQGISYAELEVLFDGIKAIRKLLIMDTCHSGEVDKEDMEEIAFVNTVNEEVTFRNTNTTTTIRETQGLEKTNEAVKEMFNDLRRGTGATVISSAGGAEYAMESDEWQNGLFTYCLLEGIKTKNADLDKNGEILLSELQNYISIKVVELSNGRQMPTSRFENLALDYRIW